MLLKEIGTTIDKNQEIRVHDSTADCRYMVLPMCPAGINCDEKTIEELTDIVTRDSMIGVSTL